MDSGKKQVPTITPAVVVDEHGKLKLLITGPPTHSVGGRLVTVAGVCRLLSSSVVCITSRRNVTHQGAARGGPVVLRPVRATPCWLCVELILQCLCRAIDEPCICYLSDSDPQTVVKTQYCCFCQWNSNSLERNLLQSFFVWKLPEAKL